MTTLIISKGDTAITIGTWCNPIITTTYTPLQGSELGYSQFGFAQFTRSVCPFKSKWAVRCFLIESVKQTFFQLITTADSFSLDHNYNWLLTMTDNIHRKQTFTSKIFIPVNEYSEVVIGARWDVNFTMLEV